MKVKFVILLLLTFTLHANECENNLSKMIENYYVAIESDGESDKFFKKSEHFAEAALAICEDKFDLIYSFVNEIEKMGSGI